jgi:hypothetical protein
MCGCFTGIILRTQMLDVGGVLRGDYKNLTEK